MDITKPVGKTMLAATLALPFALLLSSSNAIAQARNGTTLAAYKTIDVCAVSDTVWRYSGVIAVWNEGAIATQGLKITDWIQTRVGNAWVDMISVPINPLTEIPAGTTQATATVFPYMVEGAPLPDGIRNVALVQITNHSGSIGTPKGPEPKATFTGTVQPCPTQGGCTYTQGYWGSKPNVTWPSPFSRTDIFYLSGQTWQQVMDSPVNTAQGYYQLAHQYIAAVLNKANGALVPSGVQDTITLAATWLAANTPATCSIASKCGMQKDWAAVLATYNEGTYIGGPQHCGE